MNNISTQAAGTVKAPNAGDIVIVDLSPSNGREQSGSRPALVVSPTKFNDFAGLCIVVALTSKIKGYAFEVAVDGTPEASVALTDSIRSIDWRARQVSKRGRVSGKVLRDVRDRLSLVLGITQFRPEQEKAS